MKHTGGLIEQMKNAKPHRTLSKEEIIHNIEECIKNMDKEVPPERRFLMGANEYEKYESDPEGYITNFCKSVWV